jgi:hypothetical protein
MAAFRGARIVRWYPLAWRRRYQDEMLAMIGNAPLTFRQAANLWMGAVDAWQRQIGLVDLFVPLAVSLVSWRVGLGLSAFGPMPIALVGANAVFMLVYAIWAWWRVATRKRLEPQTVLPRVSRRATFGWLAIAAGLGAMHVWQMEGSSPGIARWLRTYAELFGVGNVLAFQIYLHSDWRQGRAPWLPPRGQSGPDRPLGLS